MWRLFEKWLCMFWDLIEWWISTIFLAYVDSSISKHLHVTQWTHKKYYQSLRKGVVLVPRMIHYELLEPQLALSLPILYHSDQHKLWELPTDRHTDAQYPEVIKVKKKGEKEYSIYKHGRKMKKKGCSITVQNEQW